MSPSAPSRASALETDAQPPGKHPARPAAGTAPAVRTARAVRAAGQALRRAAPALAAYAAVRAVGLAVLAFWAHNRGVGLSDLLTQRWDSVWYVGIADHGYDHGSPPPDTDGVVKSSLAFFPLYPTLIRLPALGGASPVSPAGTALLVSTAAAFLAAWGLYATGTLLHDRRAGIALAALWGILPHAVVESMAYTEPLFTALAVWSLYAALTRRWVWAGALCVLAGLTRPTGIALAAALAAGAALELGRQLLRARGPAPGSRKGTGAAPRRVLAGALIAPLGWLGYVGWVGLRTGSPGGYFTVQARWGSRFDGGRDTWHRAVTLLTGSERAPVVLITVTAVLATALTLYLLCVLDRQPLLLLVYSGMLLLITLGGTNFYNAKARFLLPAFPLLLPPAVALARARPRTAAVLLGSGALASAVYCAHLALVWTHSP